MWEQNLLHESNYHSQAEVTEIAEAESSPLNEFDFVIDTFHHATGCALVKVVGDPPPTRGQAYPSNELRSCEIQGKVAPFQQYDSISEDVEWLFPWWNHTQRYAADIL